jgi:hypothetical protein
VLKRFLPVFFGAVLCVVIINLGCTKLDTTNLGVDIIPAVDNVNTFADTLPITSSQGVFNDTSRILSTDLNVLGKISNDPLFGQTDARVFFQLKPAYYPFYFGNAGDTTSGFPGTGVDSLVLCLSYNGAWGDTTVPQVLEVRQLKDLSFDSPTVHHDVNYLPSLAGSTVIGTGTVDFRSVGNKVIFAHGKDSVTNQIRIKLSPQFTSEFYGRDSSNNPLTNAFKNDSLYRNYLSGFAITATSGNAVMYIKLADVKTRLEIHYRSRNKLNNRGVPDTSYNAIGLVVTGSPTIPSSASSNYVARNLTALARTGTATEHYLQTAPGTFINLTVPQLTGMTNRIVHRATIIMEQKPDNVTTDSLFSAPGFVYLDLVDTSSTTPKWKPIYYDLNPSSFYDPDNKIGSFFPYADVDHSYYGGYSRHKTNAIGQSVVYYEINVPRHVQRIVSQQKTNYQMRVFAPYQIIYPQYSPAFIPYKNALAYGRVRLRSGGEPNPDLRMRMIIIYSKL